MSIDLFQPYKIGKMELRNRFVRSATWDDTADSSGAVTEKSVAIYSRLAKGNIGLIVSGYAFISNQGQAVYGQYGVHTDKMIPGLRKLVRVVHQAGGKIAIQIVHAGISSDYLRDKGITPLAVSYLPEVKRTHREMSDEEIQIIIADFAAAARRGVEAGFDAVQLHGAHGYLMSQFISPLNNRRIDRWGGSAENRRRFHLEVIRAIRKEIGTDFPLLIKFGVKDDREGGLALSEGVEAARLMAGAGIDAIEVSAGIGTSTQVVKENEPERSFYRDRAAAVKQVVSVPVITVGGIRSLKMAQNIVDSGDADLISMSRPFIREPGLLTRWLKGEVEPARCITCNRCMALVRRKEPLECGEERRQREEAAKAKTQ
jgi:2,4-dienoyl-CoA reductase-like NADH-dependent reductase (Old Yellow Enzyme family)